MWLSASLESTHGFSTRTGGVSREPFESLNLSSFVGDEEAHVHENRRRALAALGLEPVSVARLRQVHSADVLTALGPSGNAAELPRGDALVADRPGLTLVIETADCYPVLLEDTEAGVIGAAHAGWRGTVAGVARNTVEAMVALGARPERIRAAIGPGICGARYAVGPEVRAAFEAAGFPDSVWLAVPTSPAGQELESALGRQCPVHASGLDLGTANAWLLESAGVPLPRIERLDRCSTDASLFSYRRDGGRTGRMWAVISRPGKAER